MGKPKTIIYDLDGVIVDSSQRLLKHVHPELKQIDYMAFLQGFKNYGRDTDGDVPIEKGIALVESLIESNDILSPFALTSRGECGRMPTYSWIFHHTGIPVTHERLIMRPERSEDELNKKDIVQFDHVTYKRAETIRIMDDYDILYAIDDHPDICAMYRDLGITTIRFMTKGVDCLLAAGDKSKEKF